MCNSNMIIHHKIKINEDKIKYKPILSSGSGGQNVNKVATAIMLKYDLKIHGYPTWFLSRIKNIYGNKISNDNIITIKSNRYRSQKLNRREAFNKLIEIFKESAKILKPRKKTRPSKKQTLKRLTEKKNE